MAQPNFDKQICGNSTYVTTKEKSLHNCANNKTVDRTPDITGFDKDEKTKFSGMWYFSFSYIPYNINSGHSFHCHWRLLNRIFSN